MRGGMGEGGEASWDRCAYEFRRTSPQSHRKYIFSTTCCYFLLDLNEYLLFSCFADHSMLGNEVSKTANYIYDHFQQLKLALNPLYRIF